MELTKVAWLAFQKVVLMAALKVGNSVVVKVGYLVGL